MDCGELSLSQLNKRDTWNEATHTYHWMSRVSWEMVYQKIPLQMIMVQNNV